ncbi:LVIVD repeat-containing protein [Pseudonocardia broussonetiae]|uniref:LVIVD repeat-containing protein n=1 Tax=Pseudonocardia broussonetiae TaxID=2736640 RepID=A0A6M6JNH0_9PSEU|nr:hypothetical protein HOP40_24270 [Pseudonocardia broussonetiae]
MGRRVRACGVAVAAVVLALLAPVPASAEVPPVPPGPPGPLGPLGPGVGEVVTSPNVTPIAHLPKQAPFDGEQSHGTDMAFAGGYAYVGNYDGFVVYDVREPAAPRVVSQVLCPGSQNDVSVSHGLLFLSTDSRWSDDTCSAVPQRAGLPYWEGIKVFDVRDPANPAYVTSMATACGSHTHTLVPDTAGESVYLYVSSYAPSPDLPGCLPPHDRISIVEVPLADPAAAAVVAEPVLFPDGGNPGPGSDTTTGCHDITAYPSRNLAAGACMGDGVLLDITDREAPRVIERVRDDANFAFWHSATFNDAGTKVVFTDELGGGSAATCTAAVGPVRGADGVYDIVDGQLEFRSYYKIPRLQGETENCVAHNGSLVPVPGRDVMVQAWYQGGVSVWDFTDSAHPVEIGFFDRGPVSATELVLGGSWSAYWYDGHVFSSDIREGLDVLAVDDPLIAGAQGVDFDVLNPQTQERRVG